MTLILTVMCPQCGMVYSSGTGHFCSKTATPPNDYNRPIEDRLVEMEQRIQELERQVVQLLPKLN